MIDNEIKIGEMKWKVIRQLGAGGFGTVYEVVSGIERAALKVVAKGRSTSRDLLVAGVGAARNVVPIIASGETEDSWLIMMPLAEKSLRDEINAKGGRVDRVECIAILRDIATALVDIQDKIVHRDIKPENILFINRVWCLTDFGISRYAESATGTDTFKFNMSVPYTAPERWRGEHATNACDIYAVGVIGYELLSGTRPFVGPRHEDFREQHLHAAPPDLPGIPSGLAAAVEECLYKAPLARPTPQNLLSRLDKAATIVVRPGLASLIEANHNEVRNQTEAARQESQRRSIEEARTALYVAAENSMVRICDELFGTIVEFAPTSQTNNSARNGGRSLRLGLAELSFSGVARTSKKSWRRENSTYDPPPFDVIAYASLGLELPDSRDQYLGRSHSLCFCDAEKADEFAWYETAFMHSIFSRTDSRIKPFSLEPDQETALVLTPIGTKFQLAWPFTRIVPGDMGDFINRWAMWLANGSKGELRSPMVMPEQNPQGSWRTS